MGPADCHIYRFLYNSHYAIFSQSLPLAWIIWHFQPIGSEGLVVWCRRILQMQTSICRVGPLPLVQTGSARQPRLTAPRPHFGWGKVVVVQGIICASDGKPSAGSCRGGMMLRKSPCPRSRVYFDFSEDAIRRVRSPEPRSAPPGAAIPRIHTIVRRDVLGTLWEVWLGRRKWMNTGMFSITSHQMSPVSTLRRLRYLILN